MFFMAQKLIYYAMWVTRSHRARSTLSRILILMYTKILKRRELINWHDPLTTKRDRCSICLFKLNSAYCYRLQRVQNCSYNQEKKHYQQQNIISSACLFISGVLICMSRCSVLHKQYSMDTIGTYQADHNMDVIRRCYRKYVL